MEAKNILKTILVAVIMTGIGIYLWGENGNKDALVCSEYLETAHRWVDEEYPSMKNLQFEDYFHSPKLKTCVAGIIEIKEIQGENKAHTSYLIVDTINNRELFGKIGFRYHNSSNEHEYKMTEQDTIIYSEYLAKITELRNN